MLVLSAGAALRIVAMVAYQPILMLQRDTYAYLSLALEMDVSGWRPSLYPLLLKPFAELGNLQLLALVQHLSGLAVAVMFYLLLRRLGVSAFLAALGVVPVLLDGYLINIEHYLLTEAFFNLFVAGALMLLVYPQRPSLAGLGASGLIIGMSLLLRFVGAVIILPALLYVLLRRLGAAAALALMVGFGIPLVIYGLFYSSQTGGSFGVTDRNGLVVYGRVHEFADCDEVELPEELRGYCPDGPIDSESRGVHASDLPIQEVGRDPHGNAKLLRFSRLMIQAKPGAYLGAVASDFVRFFEAKDPAAQEPEGKRWRFVRTLEEAEPHPQVRANGGAPPPTSGIATEFKIAKGPASFLRSYQNVAYLYGPLLAALLLVGLVGGLSARYRPPERWSPGLEGLLFTLVSLCLLAGPTMVAVYHFRYVLTALPLAGVAGAIGFEVLRRRFSERRLS
ncbi:MAG: phospholipid carrier-dependent glycosyltransferase [Actinomycetota bacterium]